MVPLVTAVRDERLVELFVRVTEAGAREALQSAESTTTRTGGDWNVDRMAAEAGLTARGLRAACKAQALPSPVHWRAWSRVFGRTLRLQGEPTVTQRILASLFLHADLSALGRLFRRELGETPDAVRERLGWQWVAVRWLERNRP